MSLRIDSSEYFSGLVIGETGLGVLAENVPSTGDSGASFLYNDISLPADSGKEIRGEIMTQPSSGFLVAYEDGSFEFSGAPDGTYTFTYRLFIDGVSSGDYTVTLAVGTIDGIGAGAPGVMSIVVAAATAAGTTGGTDGTGTGAPASFSLSVPMAYGYSGVLTLTPADISAIAAAVLAALNATTGTRTMGEHLQIQTAVLAGTETGAGTSHITFTDGTATVEADVPLPGVVGNRTNVVISV